MRTVRSSTISALVGAVAAIWLGGVGPASAGAGGGDGGIVQPTLNALCNLMAMTQLAPSCPQLPRATQVILEYAALANVPPDFARGPSAPGGVFNACSVAGNEGIACSENALNAVNQPVPAPIDPTKDLANLTPLAFTINSQGQATPTQADDPAAVSFLYVVTTTTRVSGQLDTLQLIYNYPSLTSSTTFTNGQVVAKISLPLQILSKTNGSERLLCGLQGCLLSVATLQIACSSASGCGPDGLTANVFGDFSSKISMLSAAALGIQWQLVPGSSIEVQVPLLVIGPTNVTKCGKAISAGTPDPADCGNDPAYFGVTPANATSGNATGSPTGINQASGLTTAFSTSVLGFTPASLAVPVGIAPHAAPACLSGVNGGACPTVAPLQSSTFPFCASFLGSNGALNRAVAAFYAISTNGASYTSAPVAAPPQVTCPF
jgi:hypothetical protein